MAVSLRAIAARAPVPVFIAATAADRGGLDDLSLDPSIRIAASPRHAHVLLVVGALSDADLDSLRRVHDQLPHPRATLFWGSGTVHGLEDCVRVEAGGDPVPALKTLFRSLMLGQRSSEPDLCADEPPSPWQGRGEHGQGGEGMMGGVPWGRPMAMTDEDLRDGLALDAYTMQIGPFLPMLPAGLVLSVTLQGDVFQKARVLRVPVPGPDPETALPDDAPDTAIAALERVRAARNLRSIARVLELLELHALAERCRRTGARIGQGGTCNMRRVRRLVALSGALPAIPADLGIVGSGHESLLHGAAARAAGQARDWRSDHPGYRRLGFQCVTQQSGDVRARLRQWLDDASQSLALLAAYRKHLGDAPPVLSPSRSDTEPTAARSDVEAHVLDDLLPGLEWHEAMLVINSFDTDTLVRMCIRQTGHKPQQTGKAA